MEMLDFVVRNSYSNNEIEVIRTGIIDVSMIDILKEFPREYGVQRLVDRGNVNRIKQSMTNLYIPSVIKVNKDWYILDGAHSKQSIKELALEGVQLVYVMYDTKGRDREVCVALNTTSKNWSTADYLQMWVDAGKEDYIWLKTIWDKYNLNHQSALCIVTGKTVGSANQNLEILRIFKNGQLKISQEQRDNAIMILNQLEDVKSYADEKLRKQRGFTNAFIKLATNKRYDHNRMLSKLSYQRDRLYKCSCQNAYVEMLEDIYNYKTKDKVYFTNR